MQTVDLTTILASHAAWLRDAPGGKCADLSGADLTNASLRRASLSGANLTGADLNYAYLSRANLSRANLSHADLSGADLSGANLSGANLTDAHLPVTVPSLGRIDAAIIDVITAGGKLEMSTWHTCDTTHCRAGWAIHLAGEAGAGLEKAIGPSAAGALIYAASGSHPVPDWLATNADALNDLRERAAY